MATAVKTQRPSPMIGRLGPSSRGLSGVGGREAAREACPTDSITSSYGVGPTDDRGRPLFGLKALRRTNTNKTLTDASSEPTAESPKPSAPSTTSSRPADICDSSGLPLFGGLRALKINSSSTTTTTTSTTTNGEIGRAHV